MSKWYKIFFGLSLFCTLIEARAQQLTTTDPPKLVVAIVVDQMRYDYLTRFYNHYQEGGFKRLIQEGFNCKNHHINYIPTTTAPGHTSIFTGTTPRYHGIIGNTWYDKALNKKIYCVQDSKVSSVGTGGTEGQKSPKKLLTTTVADQNRLHTQLRGKTISISIKDRAAILSGGHTANAAYWFRGKNQGTWISSSYYIKELPKWVKDFNESNKIESYLRTWNTLLPISTLVESGSDDNDYESGLRGKKKPVFPYELQYLKEFNGEYDILRQTPFGNSLTTDFAMAAIQGEQLGQDMDTDFLIISFSSTDYIGHNFGVNSKEIEDAYIRLDRDIERLLKKLDSQVGKNGYLLFLTADHGATQVPSYLTSLDIPSGYFKEASVSIALKQFARSKYDNNQVIKAIANQHIYLDNMFIEKKNFNAVKIQNDIKDYLMTVEGVDQVFTKDQLYGSTDSQEILGLIQKGYHNKRSGDLIYTLNPSTISYSSKGSSHGSGFAYDTHIPLLFYGHRIKSGESYRRVNITDIAVTIASILGISQPNGATGTIITEVIK